ncbi:MAG: EamA family transporter [Alphaproteobacteria bacterium]|nr:EamA family transporter [Alphaproteobacteria bacterium]
MSTQGDSKRHSLLSGATVDRPAHAATLMVGALFLLGFQDSIVKLASSELSLWQFQMIRAGLNLLLLILLTRVIWGTSCPPPKRVWAVALRSLFLVGAMVFYFGGIPFLPLANIAAGLYVFPLFVAVLSAVLLGERVGPRRIIAILTGFAGTLLILKPGTNAFQLVALMPVGAALCYAGTILTTRRLCRDESPVTLAFGVAITFFTCGALGVLIFTFAVDVGPALDWPYLFTGWHSIEFWVLALIAVCSLLNLTANMALARAYQSAEASWLAPFDYSYIVFATFWGFVFWQHIPDALTFTGMAMIAGAGVFVAWRERIANQRATAEGAS